MGSDVASVIATVFTGLVTSVALSVPRLLAGLIILLIGLISARILQRVVEGGIRLLMLERWVEKTKIAKASDVHIWEELLAQLVRWSVIILFLVPALETWGVPRVTEVLDQLLLYLPKVFVAAVVGFLGIIISNLVYGFVRHGVKSLDEHSSNIIAVVSRYAILFFTALVVLHQLGVAAELVQILFTGIVAMVAIAGGLAFGLGGQDTARDILKGIRDRIEK